VHHSQRFRLCLTQNNISGQLIDNEEPIVWHEPILDSFWDQLEAAIEQKKLLGIVTKIDKIHVENVEIKKERLAALVAVLLSGRATNSSTQVIFDNANICEEGIVWLSKLVDASSNLSWLSLHHNRIDNMESARCLSRALKSPASVTLNYLCLDQCNLGSNPEILSVILQSDVRYIYLTNNNIDSSGAVKIAEYLEGNPPIHYIGLDHNRLNDDDAILISQALKRNTNLLVILLHSNNITSVGVKALLNCVFDSSSLNAMSESNHTLNAMVFFTKNNNKPIRLVCCVNKLLNLDRKAKIVLALQDKESLLKYLANVPVKLIPEVLVFPCRQVEYRQVINQPQRKHLNIVYCTMRWWNMPMLYSYHQSCVNSNIKRKVDN
jgi:hypothetical protein